MVLWFYGFAAVSFRCLFVFVAETAFGDHEKSGQKSRRGFFFFPDTQKFTKCLPAEV